MHRTARLALLSLTLFFLVFPFTLGKPGLPPNLKSDEAAYYLMALSLAHDGDLRLEPRDVDRAFQEFPFQPISNLIVMTDDGWRTVYFGKPYLYSLFAAPFAAAAGANGILCFNMALLWGMIWLGAVYLERFNSPGTAALFAAGFFLLSTGFAYAFWMQPEVFNMAAVAAALWLGLDPPEAPSRRGLLLAAGSGAALALAVYNKPVLALLGLPVLVALALRRRPAPVASFLAGGALCLAAAAGVAWGLTGHPTAYLGVLRSGVTLCEPGKVPIAPAAEPAGAAPPAASAPAAAPVAAPTAAPPRVTTSRTGNAWSWLFHPPETTPRHVLENLRYFFWGRHTGLLLYLPFAAVAFAFFLRRGRRGAAAWTLVAAMAGVALFFLVLVSFNWHGGGGFIGNRYFTSAYPGFLFLVRELKPRWPITAGFGWAGLFLGPLLFSPFGAGVPEPTLQAHVRNAPFRFFPVELSLRNVPGYERLPLGDLRVIGRRDVFLPQGDELWLRGASRDELWLVAPEPIADAVFTVRSYAPNNRIDLRLGKARRTLELGAGEEARVELQPGGPDRLTTQWQQTFAVHRLVVEPRTGRVRHWTRQSPPNSCPYFAWQPESRESFFVGAALTYLGSRAQLDADVYAARWDPVAPPERLAAGAVLTLPVRVVNRSGAVWPARGGARVHLSYHWRRADGSVAVHDGLRTPLPGPVAPGEAAAVAMAIRAPEEPGSYVLELDPLLEHVAWFSERGAAGPRAAVEVVPR